MRALRLIMLLIAALSFSACSLLPEEKDETKGWSAEKIYTEGKSELDNGNYTEATKLFEKLEARFPFGRYAQQALLEVAYAYYKGNEPESAIAALDRFIKTYPRHPSIDYAYYLKGLVNFTSSEGILEKFLPGDPSQRDIGRARNSFQTFALLLRKYPDSRYAEDAQQRMRILRSLMAGHEVHVAQFYMERKAYVAAANRAKHVIENYQGTPVTNQALQIMVDAYTQLGITDLASDAQRVLDLNQNKTKAVN